MCARRHSGRAAGETCISSRAVTPCRPGTYRSIWLRYVQHVVPGHDPAYKGMISGASR
jgi:hypothetical protein